MNHSRFYGHGPASERSEWCRGKESKTNKDENDYSKEG